MTTSTTTTTIGVPVPPPREDLALPPAAPRTGAEAASACAARSPITHLRYVALGTGNLRETVTFYQGIWGLYPVATDGDVVYLGAVGSPEPFVIRVRAAGDRRTDVIAFGARSVHAVDELAATLGHDGVRLASEPHRQDQPGAGYGFRFFDYEGRLVEVSADVVDKPFRQLEERESVPEKLSHVVLNSADLAGTMAFYVRYFGMRVSDWIEDRVTFLRCSENHHSLALAQAPQVGTNHISFEMRGIDEYLRGTGRLVGAGQEPLWGPGRHSAGDNVYSYFNDPNDFVVEYTTALEQITDEDAWVPRVWPGTADYADRWGTAGPGEDLFAVWNRTPTDSGLWTPSPV